MNQGYSKFSFFNNYIKNLFFHKVSQEIPNTSTPLKFVHELFKKNYQNDTSLQETNSKGTRFLGSKAVSVLNKWFIENRDYPYPDEQTTDYLAREAEISVKQVKKWFANKRVRSQLCCKSVHRSRKSKNYGQLNDSLKYSNQQEMYENKRTDESICPPLKLSLPQSNQHQGTMPLTPSSLLQPSMGLTQRLYSQMPVAQSHLMRPFGCGFQNSGSSPLYGQLMLMNLIVNQRQAQMNSFNLLSKLSNQSVSTTSASISSGVSNSSSNSNEDYLNDLQEEDEGEMKDQIEGDEDEEDDDGDDDEQIVDVDESNDYRHVNGKRIDQGQNFYSMLMMNGNFCKRETSHDNDDHITAITPPPSGTSMYTTSSSSVPFISSSSSSSSCSNSSNNSKNTTPNTDSNKFYSADIYTEKDHVLFNYEINNEHETKTNIKKEDKKINFAIISTLVD